jgi:hypothetical protein
MDLTKEEMRIYLGTLGGILKLINDMESPTVKKIRQLLVDELAKVKESVH